MTTKITEHNSNPESAAKPFLKWVGGKGQLLPRLRELYPQKLTAGNVKHYYEPFLGGGALFFDIMQNHAIESATLCDINEELILAYRVIQQDVNTLMDFLARYQKQYIALNKEDRKAYFYDIRETYNRQRFLINYQRYSEAWIPRAAQMIFMNRTCYNGLYRVNSKGEYNAPAGDYKNPRILDQENLLRVSALLSRAHLKTAPFTEVLNDFKTPGLVYFDPPYRPLTKTASFTGYSKHAFDDEAQQLLAQTYHTLHEQGALVMLSNSDPKNIDAHDHFFDDLYAPYNIYRIPARRSINSKGTGRGVINEIFVTNY